MAAPASGGATAGLCTQENGVLGYNEVSDIMS